MLVVWKTPHTSHTVSLRLASQADDSLALVKRKYKLKTTSQRIGNGSTYTRAPRVCSELMTSFYSIRPMLAIKLSLVPRAQRMPRWIATGKSFRVLTD
jgi:hypothetical protein